MTTEPEVELSKELKPGSIEAFAAGCKCPRMDNRWGRGIYDDENGVAQFVTAQNCPLHGWPEEEIPT